jgi:hypothetical protein
MTSTLSVRHKPEEEELLKKQEELLGLESELIEGELSLANLKANLSSFEGEYLRRVGTLYAELDEIEAKIAELQAKRTHSVEYTKRATEAREKAQESYSAAHFDSAQKKEFTYSPELNKLYREVAKRIHPDLATNESDRLKRDVLMARANIAYENGDEQQLRQILAEYESSPDTVQGDGVAADLVRTIRKISQIKIRLEEIKSEVELLSESELNQLMKKVAELKETGRDLLDEMSRSIQLRITETLERLNEVRIYAIA